MLKRIGILKMSDDSNQFYSDLLPLKIGKNELEIRYFDAGFKKIKTLIPDSPKEVRSIVVPMLRKVSRVKHVFVPNILIHEVLDEVFSKLEFNFEIIHPLESLIAYLNEKNINEIVLFGTIHSMQDGYVSNYLLKNNIKCVFPNKEDIKAIEKIRRVTSKNGVSQKNLVKFNHLVNKYAIMTPVVLACSELSMVYNNSDSNVHDVVRITIERFTKEHLE